MTRRHALVGLLVVVGCLRAGVVAGQDIFETRTLRGLLGVYVIVELESNMELDGQHQVGGLREADLKTDVELQLRVAGVRVLSQEESLRTPGMPSLYVDVSAFPTGLAAQYAYCITVEVNQWVVLASGAGTTATTWEK